MELQTVSVGALLALRRHKLPHLVLDVREPDEFEAWHIPQAQSAPFGSLWAVMHELGLPTDACIVLYCNTGRRARWAALKLGYVGYTNLRVLCGRITPTATPVAPRAGT